MHIATAAGGVNLTMSELLRQQKFLEAFDLVPEVVPMADGAKILSAIFSSSIDLSPMSGIGQVFPAVERGADLKINLGPHAVRVGRIRLQRPLCAAEHPCPGERQSPWISLRAIGVSSGNRASSTCQPISSIDAAELLSTTTAEC